MSNVTPLWPEPTTPAIHMEGGNLSDAVDEAEDVIVRTGTEVYQRGGLVVRPSTPDREGVVDIVHLNVHAVMDVLTSLIVFTKYSATTKQNVQIDCPEKVAQVLISRVGRMRLKPLKAIVTAPCIRPDGSLLTEPGFDDATGIFFNPGTTRFKPVAENPSIESARKALDYIKELIAGFGFVSEADRSVSLSAILTAMSRHAYVSAPMHAFTAPVMGSGKSKLVEIAVKIATGKEPSASRVGANQEEMEKHLGADLLKGKAHIFLDNCIHQLGGEMLSQALTQSSVSVRVLGKSVNIDIPNCATIYATGNNLMLSEDMPRRTLFCNIDPEIENPELREFEFEPLAKVGEDRANYVAAALTILRAYIVAGKPPQAKRLGSFEGWSDLVRSSLIWLGEADPVLTMNVARNADPKLQQLVAVVGQWREMWNDKKIKVRDIITACGGINLDFTDAFMAVAGVNGTINARSLGRWIAAHKGRIVNGYRIEAATVHDGLAQWRLVKVEPESSGAATEDYPESAI